MADGLNLKNKDRYNYPHHESIGRTLDGCIKYTINNWFGDTEYNLIPLYKNITNCGEISPNVSNSNVNLCYINKKNSAIWISTKGEIQYRLTIDGKIETSTMNKVSLILSAYCKQSFQIVNEKIVVKETKNQNKISIHDLILVEDEKFEPYESKEFFSNIIQETPMYNIGGSLTINKRIYYINTFKPSKYLQICPDNASVNIRYSIILQYLYHLSSYKKDRFLYILNWLASFFKNLQNKSEIPLVLVGNNSSGKELFFDEIISSLFGEKYCTKITDYNLDITNHEMLIKNKIFYNFHNLSTTTISKRKNLDFLKNLFTEKRISIENNKQILHDITLYGQILITTDNDNISNLHLHPCNYTVFKVPDDINSMYLPDEWKEKLQNKTMKHLIQDDLENFATILKLHAIDTYTLHKPFDSDDKEFMQLSLEAKLKKFHLDIINRSEESLHKIFSIDSNLYQDMKDDFDNYKIKQKNIYSYFSYLYPKTNINSPRTLMVNLRQIDNDFYDVDKIENGKAGKKYFLIPNNT